MKAAVNWSCESVGVGGLESEAAARFLVPPPIEFQEKSTDPEKPKNLTTPPIKKVQGFGYEEEISGKERGVATNRKTDFHNFQGTILKRT